MSIVKVRGEIAMWACAGPARSHEMHFDSILNNSNTLARWCFSHKGFFLRHTHTCSELSLRILLWNASYVQKHSNYTWQERVDEETRQSIKQLPSPKPAQNGINWKLARPFQWSHIAPKMTDCENRTESGNQKETIDFWRFLASPLAILSEIKWFAGTCSWSDCISSPNISSFVGHGLMNGAVAPCWN